jgi:hypothetical protein
VTTGAKDHFLFIPRIPLATLTPLLSKPRRLSPRPLASVQESTAPAPDGRGGKGRSPASLGLSACPSIWLSLGPRSPPSRPLPMAYATFPTPLPTLWGPPPPSGPSCDPSPLPPNPIAYAMGFPDPSWRLIFWRVPHSIPPFTANPVPLFGGADPAPVPNPHVPGFAGHQSPARTVVQRPPFEALREASSDCRTPCRVFSAFAVHLSRLIPWPYFFCGVPSPPPLPGNSAS